jgi:hypothetical protein
MKNSVEINLGGFARIRNILGQDLFHLGGPFQRKSCYQWNVAPLFYQLGKNQIYQMKAETTTNDKPSSLASIDTFWTTPHFHNWDFRSTLALSELVTSNAG